MTSSSFLPLWQTVQLHALGQEGSAWAYLSMDPPNKHHISLGVHCVLSWQSSKHSRDVFRRFVLPVFTNVPGTAEVKHSSEYSSSSIEEEHTQGQRKKTNLGSNNVQCLSYSFPSYQERILMNGLFSACAFVDRTAGLNIWRLGHL